MAELSHRLEALASDIEVPVHPEVEIPVVVYLEQPVEETLSLDGDQDREVFAGRAFEVAAAAGAPRLARVPGLWPQSTLSGQRTVYSAVRPVGIEDLRRTPGVAAVRLARLHRPHLDVSCGALGVDASVRSRWDGQGVTVAVLDSGIDRTHPAFRDGSARISAASRNFTTEGGSSDVDDLHGHGSHVAGILAGDGSRFRGVAPGVTLLICKVFDQRGVAPEGAVLQGVRHAVSQGVDIINYSGGFSPVVRGRATVAPPWVWSRELTEEEAAFQDAVDQGILPVVSAGNDGELAVRRGTLSLPATCPATLSVGAVARDGSDLAAYSSWGPVLRSRSVSIRNDQPVVRSSVAADTIETFPEVDLIGPGGYASLSDEAFGGCRHRVGIASVDASRAASPFVCRVSGHPGYRRWSGTSQAAPHVAGLAALTLQAARTQGLALGNRPGDALKSILLAAGRRLPVWSHDAQGFGISTWPRVEGILDQLAAGELQIGAAGELVLP